MILDWAFNAESAYSAKGGYGSAWFTGAPGYYPEFTICDLGPGDGLRARGEIWWKSGQLNLEAAGGSGSCVMDDYPIPRGQWFSMRACLRNGSAGTGPQLCGPVYQGVEP
jgi:hypothetical protein